MINRIHHIMVYVHPCDIEYFFEYIDTKNTELRPPSYKINNNRGDHLIGVILDYDDYVWMVDNGG